MSELTLTDYYADWCGPCKMMDPVIKKFASIHSDIPVVKINTDHTDVTALHISTIPTFIFRKDGEEVLRHSGAIPLAKLEALVAQLKETVE